MHMRFEEEDGHLRLLLVLCMSASNFPAIKSAMKGALSTSRETKHLTTQSNLQEILLEHHCVAVIGLVRNISLILLCCSCPS